MIIRAIQQKDNAQIAKVIRDIFHELDAPKVGTAYADPILDTLFEVYQAARYSYYVVEKDGKVERRGINSIQLVFENNRWYIISWIFCGETDKNVIPKTFDRN